MRHPAKGLSWSAAVLVVVCLAVAGCGSTGSSVIGKLPSRTAATTAAPTTAAPTTAAPTTAAPTTAAPTTATATATTTTTATATTTTTTTASPSVSPSPSAGSGTRLLWLWILLAVLVLAGLIALIARSRRRHSADAASRQSGLIEAYAKGSALHDAMSVAETLGATGDVGARWADIQRRADDLSQTLYSLREAVSDPAEKARIADVLVSLQAVRSAMDAERAPGGASPQQAQVASDRLYAFELSLRALRGSSQEFS